MQAIPNAAREALQAETAEPSSLTLAINQSLLEALVVARAECRSQETTGDEADRPQRLVIDADEVTFRVGGATLSLTKENGGTLEIRAGRVRLHADEILSEAVGTNTVAGEHVVAEAEMHADLLGKLIRIDGQAVKINS